MVHLLTLEPPPPAEWTRRPSEAAAAGELPLGAAWRPTTARPVRWFASEADRLLLARHGLDRLESLLELARTAPARHVGRTVRESVLDDASGCGHRLFLKAQWRRARRRLRLRDLACGPLLQSWPEREWNGLLRLRRLGLYAAEPVALLRRGLVSRQAVVVVRAVPPVASLAELIASGRWSRLDRPARTALLDEIAAVLRTIHAGGLRWRGAKAAHLFPQRRADGGWRLWLIDCEGVQRRLWRSELRSDARRLFRSLAECGVDGWTLSTLRSRCPVCPD